MSDTAPTFADDAPAFVVDNPDPVAFTIDPEARTIRGLALPFGDVAESRGRRWSFGPGALTWGKVKVLDGHDWARAVGTAELEETAEGITAVMRIARGARGDEVLELAAAGVYDGLSVGLGTDVVAEVRDGIHYATSGSIREVSTTPLPAFTRAAVTSVAASAAQKGHPMKCTKCNQVHGEGVIECAAAPVEGTAPDFSAVTDAIRDGFAALTNPQQGIAPRQVVPPAGTVEVREELPYRFDGHKGAHSFSQDIRDAYTSGDSEARQRVETFMADTFAVSSTDTGALNPTQNRPELYVPNLTYSTPLYDLVSTGGLDDKTPFTVPKFKSSGGLVGDHTEGVEPTPGTFQAESQTITPAPMSGKIEINREVWDQGGSPQADAIIWAEMLNGWFEAREVKIAAALKGVTGAELNLAGAVDAALVDALTDYYAGLQFVRGGNRFTATAADGQLFPKLIAAKDSTGRKLLPVIGPQNAQGTTSGGFDRVALGSQEVRAAWALGAGNDAQSYNFVPSSVWAWFSAPQKFTFEYQVKSIDLAIWGYGATAVLRDSDVKPIDYTTADV